MTLYDEAPTPADHGMVDVKDIATDTNRWNVIHIPVVPQVDGILKFPLIQSKIHVHVLYREDRQPT